MAMWGKDTPGREKGKGKGLEAGLAWHVLEITRRPVWLEGPEVWEEQRGERSRSQSPVEAVEQERVRTLGLGTT